MGYEQHKPFIRSLIALSHCIGSSFRIYLHGAQCGDWSWSPRLTNLTGTGAWLLRNVSICNGEVPTPHPTRTVLSTDCWFHQKISEINIYDIIDINLFVALFQEHVEIGNWILHYINQIFCWAYFVCTKGSGVVVPCNMESSETVHILFSLKLHDRYCNTNQL